MAQELYDIEIDALSYDSEEFECDVDYLSYDIDSCLSSNLDVELLPGKSAYEIALKYGFSGTEQEWLNSLKANAMSTSTKEYWESHPEIIPTKGEVIIITNYSVTDAGQFAPAIKVGDGIHNVLSLPNLSGVELANKLTHSITIGNKKFDGSADVFIDVYSGDINNPLDELTTTQNLYNMTQANYTNDSMRLVDYNPNDYLSESNNMAYVATNTTQQMGINVPIHTMSTKE